jgi:hypothetical protein
MLSLRQVLLAVIPLTMLLMAGCGGSDAMRMPPTSPPPPTPSVTASAYILPDAVSLGDWAFGDEPIVIYKNERLRWVNADTLAHVIVADSPDANRFSQDRRAAPQRRRTVVHHDQAGDDQNPL